MTEDPATLSVPAGDFAARMDVLLEKGEPDRAVPWAALPPPSWAVGFSPRVIIDLGSGTGGFIHSVLLRLGQWGCLDRLERVVLFERDAEILPGGAPVLRDHLRRQAESALAAAKPTAAVRIEISLDPVAVNEGPDPLVTPLETIGLADLIVTSHVTYYFGDGSGAELIDTLCRRHLAPGGRLWCVIRKLECPIYRARAATLKRLAVADTKPYDYAEWFESKVIPSLGRVRMLGMCDNPFLADTAFTGRAEAAHLLMWRLPPPDDYASPYWQASQAVVAEPTPIFTERHFILEKGDVPS
jgi:hypothetical protein